MEEINIEEVNIENVMRGKGHQGQARFQYLVDDISISGIGISRRKEIGNVIIEIINKIGNKHGISIRDVNVGRSYGQKGAEDIIDGIVFQFNASDSDSEIKGNIYIGFLRDKERPIYIFHTHVDLLGKLTLSELNKFAKDLMQTVKDNRLKLYLKGERYNETLYGDPVIYRIGKRFNADEFIKFLADIEVIANKFPLYGKGGNLLI